MIISDIQNWNDENLLSSERIVKAIEYLKNSDLVNMENGRYEIDGENLYVILTEVETQYKNNVKPESHGRYIDIHYLILGEEVIGYKRKTTKDEVLENILEEKDALLYKEIVNESDLVLAPGMFAIFYPADIHRPGCCVKVKGKVRKAIVKIRIN